jgi:hypothetical protein
MRHAISNAACALRSRACAGAVAILALAAAQPAQAQQAAALSPARYVAVDAVFFASLPLDGNPTAAERAELLRVCDALDRGDPLLAVTRTSCLAALQAIAPSRAFARCSTRRGCLRSARRLRILLSRTLTGARASNAVVEHELAPGACRTELRSSRALLRALTALRDGLRLLERGLSADDRALIRRAERRVSAARGDLDDEPTAAQSLEIFRGVCAPAAAPQGR